MKNVFRSVAWLRQPESSTQHGNKRCLFVVSTCVSTDRQILSRFANADLQGSAIRCRDDYRGSQRTSRQIERFGAQTYMIRLISIVSKLISISILQKVFATREEQADF